MYECTVNGKNVKIGGASIKEWLVKTQAMAANGRYVWGAVNTVRRCWPHNTRTMWSIFFDKTDEKQAFLPYKVAFMYVKHSGLSPPIFYCLTKADKAAFRF